MLSDETLYKDYLNGEDSGLELLMERYGDSLKFYINGYLHDLYDSEDLMIDAFAYLIAKKPKIKEGCFKAYLYKMARNLSLRFISKKRLNLTFSLEEIGKEPVSDLLIEKAFEREEDSSILHLCLDQLNPSYREALYLVYFENMKHNQAGKVMGKSEKQVSDLIYRGRKALRKRLEEEGLINEEY